MQLNEGFESFMNVILGKPKKVFAIDNAQCSRVVDEFKERMINGTLPEPAEVIIHSKHIEAEEEQTPESMMKSLFPNIEIIDD
jgi:DNA polymerase-3 subunit gamma/tau